MKKHQISLQKTIILMLIISIFSQQSIAAEKNDIFLKFGGFVDSSFANSSQSSEYSTPILPNSNSTLASINRQNNSHGDLKTRTSSRFDITAGAKINDKTAFGATIVLNSLISSNEDDMGNFANQNYLFLNSEYGRHELGVAPTSAATMRIDATTIARGSGGIAGNWFRFVAMPTFDTSGFSTAVANELAAGYMPIFLFQPMLPNEAGFTSGATQSLFIYNGPNQTNPQLLNGKYDAMYYNRQQPRFGHGLQNGGNYYTPRYNGLQFGISYAPDTGNAGGLASSNSAYIKDGSGNYISRYGQTSSSSGDVRSYISMGLNYKEQFDNLGVALSATYERGIAESMANPYGVNGGCTIYSGSCVGGFNGRNNLSAYSFGGKLLYAGFSLAGSVGSWGHSLQATPNFSKDGAGNYVYPWLVPFDSNGKAMSNWEKTTFSNIGIAYGFGPINFSVTKLNTNYMGNKLSALSFGTDFKISAGKFKGLIPYIEYTQFSMQGRTTYLQSTGSAHTPVKNEGGVLIAGIRIIF